MEQRYLIHSGILGMKWGIRRYQNKDGTLTEEGKKRYYKSDGSLTNEGRKWQADERKKKAEHPELMTEEEIDEFIRRMNKEIQMKSLLDKMPKENPTKKEKKKQTLEEDIKILELEVRKKDLQDQKNKKGKYSIKSQQQNNQNNQNNSGNGKKNKNGNNNNNDAFNPNRSLINLLWNASKKSAADYVSKNLANDIADRGGHLFLTREQRMEMFKNRANARPEYMTTNELKRERERQELVDKYNDHEKKRLEKLKG